MIGARTRLAAVLGSPVDHSLSPVLHNAAFAALEIDAVYLALEVDPEDLDGVLRALAAVGALGASVTVPHKRAVMACCDRLSPEAERIGAVNCLAFDGGEVFAGRGRELRRRRTTIVSGHNTDAGGFTDALLEARGQHPDGWRPLLLGGGGAARAVALGLEALTGSMPPVIARAPDRVDWTDAAPWTDAELRRRVRATNLLIDCTAAGLSAETETDVPAEIPIELLDTGALVSTLVYHREPRLLTRARARGLDTLDGAGMLVHQARRALALWTGRQVDTEILWRAMRVGLGTPGPGAG